MQCRPRVGSTRSDDLLPLPELEPQVVQTHRFTVPVVARWGEANGLFVGGCRKCARSGAEIRTSAVDKPAPLDAKMVDYLGDNGGRLG